MAPVRKLRAVAKQTLAECVMVNAGDPLVVLDHVHDVWPRPAGSQSG